jgi:short-subunit dehydrogenase
MKTVLITGATEGIGLEFARLFAQKKNNLVLVARNEARLQEISRELCSHKINIKYYAKDLSILKNAEYIYNDLKENKIYIDCLVNNAGFGINGSFIDIDCQRELEMYNLNMITLAYFTKVFAKDMVSGNSGRILNIASTGAFQPGPYMAGYCATKAFVLSLSEAVNYELKGTNVSITTLCPGVTDTKFHSVAQTEKTLMSRLLSHAKPADVAKYGYNLMMKGKPVAIHGLSNKIIILLDKFSSRNIVTASAAKLLRN